MAKQVLRPRGLCLRHIGAILNATDIDLGAIGWACSLPNACTPGSQAVEECNQVVERVLGARDRVVCAVVGAARAFAAKSAVLRLEDAVLPDLSLKCSPRADPK